MMAAYIQLKENNVQEIANAYGLAVVSFEPIDAGASNSNYLLYTQQGRYVLTVFDDKSLDYTIRLGKLLLFLAEQDFPTTRLLSSIKGGTNTVYEGKPVMIKAYITGQVHRNLDQTMLRQIGAAMARLHQIPVPDFLSNKLPYGVKRFASVVGQNIEPEYESWIAKKLPYLEQQIQQEEELPHGLIHGDLFYDNVLFVERRLAAIIDFECAIHHYKVFDLAMGIVGLCGRFVGALDHVRALVNGYQEVRELEEREKKTLQLFIEYAATTVSCWRFWKYHIDRCMAEKVDKHRQMVKMAQEIKGIPPAQFSGTIFG
jgi:homoserine kinase type II